MMIISQAEVWMYLLPGCVKYLSADPNIAIVNIHGVGFKMMVG